MLTRLTQAERRASRQRRMSTRRDNSGPRPTALGDVLDGTRRVTLQRSRAAVDRDTWRRAVGRRIADRTDVGQLKQGELTVYVASAAWAQELSLLTREIIERLGAHGVRVEKVRFRLKAPQAPRAERPSQEEKPAPPPKPLPAEFRARLDRVSDDELRGAIAGAAELALSRLAHGAERPATRLAERKPERRAGAPSPPEAARNPRAAASSNSAPHGERKPRAAASSTPAPIEGRSPQAVANVFTSALQAARNPRAAGARSAPSGQSSAGAHASRPRKREGR